MDKCWCGNDKLDNYSDDYLLCGRCHTLVSKAVFQNQIYHVSDEENDLYGKNYWEKTMIQEAGVETLDEIIDMYLCERVPYWLKYILKYIPLDGKVAEIGCGLGQLAYLMKQIGYNQTAYELSPHICEYVQDRLGIDIVCKPFAETDETYNAILAFDVLEHILDPQEFISNCTSHLANDGIMCLQTPCYDETLSYQEMCQQKPHFNNLLVKDQHIYLYSRESIKKILESAGMLYFAFEPAFFGDDYDMFLFASKEPICINSEEQIRDFYYSSERGRIVKALISLSDKSRIIEKQFLEADSDRMKRMEQITSLTDMLKESEADRAARLEQINTLTQMLKESEADRVARLEQINTLTQQLKESEADRSARLEQINTLTQLLKDKTSHD